MRHEKDYRCIKYAVEENNLKSAHARFDLRLSATSGSPNVIWLAHLSLRRDNTDIINTITRASCLLLSALPTHSPAMATLAANRGMDFNSTAAAAREHTQAVTRNYISQPRLSM